jgi:hypothetical protein
MDWSQKVRLMRGGRGIARWDSGRGLVVPRDLGGPVGKSMGGNKIFWA